MAFRCGQTLDSATPWISTKDFINYDFDAAIANAPLRGQRYRMLPRVVDKVRSEVMTEHRRPIETHLATLAPQNKKHPYISDARSY